MSATRVSRLSRYCPPLFLSLPTGTTTQKFGLCCTSFLQSSRDSSTNAAPKTTTKMPSPAAAAAKPVLHEYDSHGDYDPELYNFHIGAPHPSELVQCSKITEKALKSISEQEDYWRSSCFQYGTVTGSDPARQALSSFLSQEHGFAVPPQNLMVTCGASMTLNLVCNEFFGRDKGAHQPVAFVEHPTYFLALDILQGLGFRVVPIPKSEDGTVNFAEWQRLAKELCPTSDSTREKSLHFRGLTYLIPTFHNPTGKSLSAETSAQILSLADAENLLIHCDDVYNFLYYTNKVPDRYFPVGTSSRVISAGSFSKLLGPGLRMGWLESTPEIVDRVSGSGVVQSGGCLNQFGAALIERAVVNGDLFSHVKDLRQSYKNKVEAFCRIFDDKLPREIQWTKPEGGYFIWLRLPDGSQEWLADVLLPRARASGVRFQLGTKSCSAARVGQKCVAGCGNSLRLSIGHVTVEQVELGVEMLCDLLRERFPK